MANQEDLAITSGHICSPTLFGWRGPVGLPRRSRLVGPSGGAVRGVPSGTRSERGLRDEFVLLGSETCSVWAGSGTDSACPPESVC